MNALIAALDKLPLATIQAVVGYVVVLIAYLNGDLDVEAALVALGANTAGAGVLGHARNGAGRGVK